MAVVAVNAPGLEHAIGVVGLAGATDVIHDLVVATLVDRRADAVTNLVERLVPRDALPLTAAPLADALHRVHDPLGVIHLIQRRWALGAVASSAGWMLRVAFDLVDLAISQRFLIRKIKSQPVRIDFTSLLLRMFAHGRL